MAFRFAFAYLLLYYPVLAVDRLPGLGWVVDGWNDGWSRIVPRVARHVFRIRADFPDMTEGLIDVSYSYARLACVVLFALVATLGWSLADRKRADYARLDEWLRVLVRYGLANAMLFYGFAKVLKHQFTAPSLELMLEPYGQLSRMGVLWSFMGSSTAYTVFCGAAECLGGALLLFRRTTTLGALLVIAVMANVVMLNFSYGVFVKLYSAHLLLMALFLAAPDLGRLWRVLVLHGATERRLFAPHFQSARARRGAGVVKAIFGVYLIGSVLSIQVEAWRSFGDAQPLPDLYGIWEVESFGMDGVEPPPVVKGEARWRRLVIDRAGRGVLSSNATVWKTTDARERFGAEEDPATKTLTLSGRNGARRVFIFARDDSDPDQMVLTGSGEAGAVRIALRRVDEKTLRLAGEGFHWASEHPFGSL